MAKFFITGIAGFVGRYFWEYLQENTPESLVLGADILTDAPWEHPAFQYRQSNLLNSEDMVSALSDFQPDYILHLASISSVNQSWKQPQECFSNNTGIFLNLAEAVRKICPKARMLSIGSSEEYGNYPADAMPLNESCELRPCNPYAVARTAQEMLSKLYAESYGLSIMLTRSFNHIGPRQRDSFVIPSFVKQLVSIKQGGDKGKILTGNTEIIRDFLDVRDVVDAYFRILTKGEPNSVYNVCSGNGVKLKDVLHTIADTLGIDPEIYVDPNLVRPTDNAVIVGDNAKLRVELGWKPKYSLEDTLKDMIQFYEELPVGK